MPYLSPPDPSALRTRDDASPPIEQWSPDRVNRALALLNATEVPPSQWRAMITAPAQSIPPVSVS
jgi:hypothetical protein